MTGTYSITPTVAENLVAAYAAALGASPKINLYSGTPPANAAAALSGNTLLATLTGAATPISGYSDTGTAGRGTWAAISPAASAAATGVATFGRTTTAAGTVVDQFGVGTSGADCNINSTSISAGSTVSMSSRTTDLPYGP